MNRASCQTCVVFAVKSACSDGLHLNNFVLDSRLELWSHVSTLSTHHRHECRISLGLLIINLILLDFFHPQMEMILLIFHSRFCIIPLWGGSTSKKGHDECMRFQSQSITARDLNEGHHGASVD